MVAGNLDHSSDHLEPVTKVGRSLPGQPELVLAMFAALLDGFSYRWQQSEGRFDGRRIDASTHRRIDASTRPSTP